MAMMDWEDLRPRLHAAKWNGFWLGVNAGFAAGALFAAIIVTCAR